MRILIVAANVSARMGGEAVLPWHYVREMAARGLEVHALTHARVRDELTERPPHPDAIFHFTEDSLPEIAFHRTGAVMPGAVREMLFNNAVAFTTLSRLGARARTLSKEIAFDVVHQPTPVSPPFPSFLTGIDAPVVIGPMNGGMAFPPAFRAEYSKGLDALTNAGRLFGAAGNAVFSGKREAARILVANERTRAALPRNIPRDRVALLPENGVDLALWTPDETARPEAPVFVFVGRMIPLKGVDMLIDAFAALEGSARLVLIGGGPARARLEAQAEARAPGRIAFTGFLPQTEIRDRLATATALILPSLRDCGGAVILEAFACGAPAIALDWGGPSDYVTPETGVLIAPSSREEVVAGLRAAMDRFASDSALATAMGAAARARVEAHFSWAAKADKMVDIYKSVIAARLA